MIETAPQSSDSPAVQGLPDSVEDWIELFFQGRRRYRPSERALRTLWDVITDEYEPGLREIAAMAMVGVGTVSRVIARCKELGFLETSGGEFEPSGHGRYGTRTPYSFHPVWPPKR